MPSDPTPAASRIHVLLDFGEIICCAQTPADIASLAELAGVAEATFRDRYWANRPDYDRGGTAEDYWTAIVGAELDDDRVRRLDELDVAGWSRLDPVTVAVIEDLHRRRVPVSMLSNAPSSLARSIERDPTFAQFRRLVFSCDLGLAKPDPRIYRAAMRELDARAEDIVFIDDRAENVAGAVALGMRAQRVTDTRLLGPLLHAVLT